MIQKFESHQNIFYQNFNLVHFYCNEKTFISQKKYEFEWVFRFGRLLLIGAAVQLRFGSDARSKIEPGYPIKLERLSFRVN